MLGYDRNLIAMEIMWENLRDALESSAGQSWRGLPEPTGSTPVVPAGLAPTEALWNADSVRTQDNLNWTAGMAANPLASRPLITAPSSSGASGWFS